MNVEMKKCEEKILTIAFSGHIDSSNAPEAEKTVQEICSEHPGCEVVVDAENLVYISSAGLRILLRLRKSYPELKIVNVSSEVYEVLDMTGFAEMIHVEKAYRKLSVEGCDVIGAGANGKVYRLDADTIIKVYFNSDALDDIQRERELARKAFVLGIPTAIPYDVVKVGDMYGSVFELLNAKMYSQLIIEDPDHLDQYVTQYVEVLKKIHETVVKPEDMPSIRDFAIGWAEDIEGEISKENYDKLKQLIEGVPEDYHMIHGDYHVKNLMQQGDEALLIDMDTLSHGNPVFEFANMFNAYVGYEEMYPKERVGEFLGLNAYLVGAIWDKTLRLYFETEDQDQIDLIKKKISIIGYVRVLRRTLRRNADTELGQKMIENAKRRLEELIPQVDTLLLA